MLSKDAAIIRDLVIFSETLGFLCATLIAISIEVNRKPGWGVPLPG